MSHLASWPALVLAAGLGTRLRPLSSVRAKAALPVAGRALVVRILEQLRDAGIRRAVLNLHHRPETIARIVGDGSAIGIDVRYSWEPIVLGSAGGPARAVPLLGADRFFVVNGDTLAAMDFEALARAHVASGALATMAVADANLAKYNAVLASDEDCVTGFAPRGSRPADRPFHFVGVQAVNAAAFAGVSPDTPSESVAGLYPQLVARRPGSVRVWPMSGGFVDIGTASDYLETVKTLAVTERRPLDVGEHCEIDPTARISGSVLWDRVRVGAGAEIVDSVVTDDVEIPAGARYHRQAITRDTVVPL